MTSLLTSQVLVRLFSRISGPSRRRQRVSFRTSLENLESRALLSAAGCDSLSMASEVHTTHIQHGKAAVPRIDGVAGQFDIFGGDIGEGTLTIVQNGLNLNGTFNAANLQSGSFQASFKTAKSRVAKGTAELAFVGDEVPGDYKFKINFKKNGNFSFRYR